MRKTESERETERNGERVTCSGDGRRWQRATKDGDEGSRSRLEALSVFLVFPLFPFYPDPDCDLVLNQSIRSSLAKLYRDLAKSAESSPSWSNPVTKCDSRHVLGTTTAIASQLTQD